MQVLSVRIASGTAPGDDGDVCPPGVAADVEGADQPARSIERCCGLVDIDDRAVLVQAQQFPRSAVVIAGPAGIQDVGEPEETVGGCGRGQFLPSLILVAWPGEHHHAADLLVHCEPGGGGRTVRDARHDHVVPSQVTAVGCQEVVPLALRVLFGQPHHELA